MKKKAVLLILCVVMAISLCACGARQVSYSMEEYILEIDYREDFRVLQLNDIHLGNKDNRELQFRFLDLTISDADPDLIVCNGDLFTFADKRTAEELFAFLDSYGVPWTLSLGNHDEQCYFSIDWLTDILNNYGSNCVFKDLQDDDIFGNSNFAINLMDGNKVHDQIIIMDSNRYYFGHYFGYDYFKESQIEWYTNLVNYTTAKNSKKAVNSIMFFHIPLPEFEDAWNAAQAGSSDAILEYGESNEGISAPEDNTGFFDVIKNQGSTKAIFVGHDHVNNFRILYQGIYMSYGINSTDRIYYQEGMIGGQVIVIHDDHSLDFEAIYHSYEEVK